MALHLLIREKSINLLQGDHVAVGAAEFSVDFAPCFQPHIDSYHLWARWL